MSNNQEFAVSLKASLPEGFEIPQELWQFIAWLEARNQCFRYRSSDAIFLPTMPVDSIDQLWSHLAFVIAPDLMRHWGGVDGLEKVIVPLVRCGGDGSHLALWKRTEGDVFVFLGSEGEAFTLTDDPRHFIMLITMGYFSIEEGNTLALTPSQSFTDSHDADWPDPVEVRQHIQSEFGVTYPATGNEIVTRISPDPFTALIRRITTQSESP